MSLADAAEKLDDWRRHDNDDRIQSAIRDNVPRTLHFSYGVTAAAVTKAKNSGFRRSTIDG